MPYHRPSIQASFIYRTFQHGNLSRGELPARSVAFAVNDGNITTLSEMDLLYYVSFCCNLSEIGHIKIGCTPVSGAVIGKWGVSLRDERGFLKHLRTCQHHTVGQHIPRMVGFLAPHAYRNHSHWRLAPPHAQNWTDPTVEKPWWKRWVFNIGGRNQHIVYIYNIYCVYVHIYK